MSAVEAWRRTRGRGGGASLAGGHRDPFVVKLVDPGSCRLPDTGTMTLEQWRAQQAPPPAVGVLVPVDHARCFDGCGPTTTAEWSQPALFLHGGYGETVRTVVTVCPACGWEAARSVLADSPRR